MLILNYHRVYQADTLSLKYGFQHRNPDAAGTLPTKTLKKGTI